MTTRRIASYCCGTALGRWPTEPRRYQGARATREGHTIARAAGDQGLSSASFVKLPDEVERGGYAGQVSDYEAELEQAKRASVAQLLFRCARLLNERALDRVAEKRGVRVRASHTSLFPHIDLGGTRQTELARRLGVSKQAVHELVTELESLGVVQRSADPDDRRATLVRFTARGKKALLDGLSIAKELEAEMASAIGQSNVAALHSALLRLDDWLSADG